uniref:TLC domain-containing protein n=1 Tax=Eutreptiella gymnastica TaxID=73025 RepID=A0A7S4FKR5_9EUGL
MALIDLGPWVYTAVCTVCLLAIRAVLISALFRPLSFKMMGFTQGDQLTKNGRSSVMKLEKYLWHTLAYIILVLWCGVVMWRNSWGFSFTAMSEYPALKDADPDIPLLQWTYMAWYCHGFVESLLVDTGRSDFLMMVVHHVLSVLMIAGSYSSGGHRVCFMVCFEQDLSDIVTYVAKMVQKVTSDPETQKPINSRAVSIQSVGAIMLSLSWLTCRHITLGIIVWSLVFKIWNDPFTVYMKVMLSTFWGLQVVWGGYIFKLTYQQVTEGYHFDNYNDSDMHQKES